MTTNPQAGFWASPRRRLAIGAWAIFAATLVAYLPALHGGFIWDDDAHVTRPALRSWRGLGQIWFRIGATQQYYPVLHSAFWIEHRLWGDAVMGYHLVNVLLHATAACLFALVLCRLIKGRADPLGPPGTTGGPAWVSGPALPWPWFAAFLFALHPVCVESVAWISEQKNTLSTVFYLLAALAYLRFDEGGICARLAGAEPSAESPARLRPLNPDSAAALSRHRRDGEDGRPAVTYLLATGLFVLALLSKSVTATLPAALLVVLWRKRGRLEWRRDVAPLLPWFVLGAAAGLFTAWVERRFVGAEGEAFTLSFLDRALLAGRIVWFYLGKLLWPAHLIFIYPRWDVYAGAAWQYLFPAGLLAALAGLWGLALRRRRAPLAGALFFVGSLFPALGFFNVYPFIFSYVADHFQYLASLGVIALAAAGWGRLLEGRRASAAAALYVLAGATVAGLGILTWRESGNYRDPVSFYRTILERNPACWMARNNLGEIFTDSGRLPDAIAQYLEALRIRPAYTRARYNLGIAYSRSNRLPEAAAEFQEALRLKPGWDKAEENLGITLAEEGRTEEAISHFESALRSDPGDGGIHADLALALANAGRLPEAMVELTEAARLKPDDPEVHGNLGLMLAREGRGEEAVAQFQRVVRLTPRSAEAHLNLAVGLIRQRRLPEAIAEFQAALKLDPDNPEIRGDLEHALRLAGRADGR